MTWTKKFFYTTLACLALAGAAVAYQINVGDNAIVATVFMLAMGLGTITFGLFLVTSVGRMLRTVGRVLSGNSINPAKAHANEPNQQQGQRPWTSGFWASLMGVGLNAKSNDQWRTDLGSEPFLGTIEYDLKYGTNFSHTINESSDISDPLGSSDDMFADMGNDFDHSL